jgi:hypothetical protein
MMEQATAPPGKTALPKCSTIAASGQPSWIEETLNAAKSDSRRQPWKEILGESVDCSLDDGEDLFRVEKGYGGGNDPDCPFRTQGSSLAA